MLYRAFGIHPNLHLSNSFICLTMVRLGWTSGTYRIATQSPGPSPVAQGKQVIFLAVLRFPAIRFLRLVGFSSLARRALKVAYSQQSSVRMESARRLGQAGAITVSSDRPVTSQLQRVEEKLQRVEKLVPGISNSYGPMPHTPPSRAR